MSCDRCIKAFVENELENIEFIQFKSQKMSLRQPCKSTMMLMRNVDSLMKRHVSQPISIEAMFFYICRNINMDCLYPSSVFDSSHDHKDQLIRLIIRTYLDIKSTQISK